MKKSVFKLISAAVVVIISAFLLASNTHAAVIKPALKSVPFKNLRVTIPRLSILNVAKVANDSGNIIPGGAQNQLAKFNFTAGNRDIAITEITFNYTVSGFAAADWRLYDGATQLGATVATGDGKQIKFTNLNLFVPAGSWKNLTLRADIDVLSSGAYLQTRLDDPAQIISDAQIINGLPTAFEVYGQRY